MSEVGLERLAAQHGFDCLKEDYTTSDERKMKNLIIAGSITQIDIILDNNVVHNVTLAFPDLCKSISQFMEPASQILLQDLKLLPAQSPLTKTLDQFALNLERLGRLDQLSITEAGFFCHEALTGIYQSLERLHQWDISQLRQEPALSGKTDQYLILLAMCSKHGLPVMHARDRVGLALQYWRERRFLPSSNHQIASSEKHEKCWSLAIDCKPMQGYEMAPVRVSDCWISKDVAKEDFTLDWQEPDNVSLPAAEEGKQEKGVNMILPDLSTKRVPQVKFTVTFDPPVILTHADWVRLHNCVGMEAQQLTVFPPTFDIMHFPIPPGAPHNASELRTIKRQRRVRVFDKDGNESEKIHKNTLFNYKRIYAMTTSELPFTHPSQLIAMLPILRQNAFISMLLENSFGPKTKEHEMTAAQKKNAEKPKEMANTTTEKDELAAYLDSTEPQDKYISAEDEINMDVSLGVHPTPHLKVIFPFRQSTANIEMQILPNGVVDVVNENILPRDGDVPTEAKGKGKQLTRSDLGKVLEHMEDLCKWVEWIRTRLS